MARKKVVAVLTGSQMIAAYMAIREVANGRMMEAAEVLSLAQLPVPPHIALAIWNEAVAREYAKSPASITVLDCVTLYDDGTVDITAWKLSSPDKSDTSDATRVRDRRQVDVNLN